MCEMSRIILTIAVLAGSVVVWAGDDGWDGTLDGVKSWRLTDTENGLSPTQNWYSVGSDPAGNIYIGSSDHKTNAALYVIRASDEKIHYAGDCVAASKAAGNLKSGETFEKFHVRPTHYQGKIYIASNNCSHYSSGCTKSRGFHWYRYDPAENTFVDLSANEPDGVGASGHQAEYLELDPKRGVIWAAITPRGHLASFNIAQGKTTDHGRPPSTPDTYLDNGGAHWAAGNGRIYFSMKGKSSFYDHVHYYEPESKSWGEKKEWKCAHLKQGHWSPERSKYYAVDQNGNLYVYDDKNDTFTHAGKFRHTNGAWFVTRSFNVHPNGRFAYCVNDKYNSKTPGHFLFELDLQSGESKMLCSIADLDPIAGHHGMRLHGGHGAWDRRGRFYFATFGTDGYGNTVVTRVDPHKLKTALGIPVAVERYIYTPEVRRNGTIFRMSVTGPIPVNNCFSLSGRWLRSVRISNGALPSGIIIRNMDLNSADH
jgi:hypothetical protein